MPVTPDELFARVVATADQEGRLGLSRMTGWEIFPFEQEGLRVVELRPPEIPEPPRSGEGGHDCRACGEPEGVVWADAHWRLCALGPSGAPLVLMLMPAEHHDLGDLPEERADELGRLTVHLTRAIESLPHVARAHVLRFGDGGAHLHVFFMARPEGFPQLRGSCFPIWDDLLPPTPREVRDADAGEVARLLAASFGGTAKVSPTTTS